MSHTIEQLHPSDGLFLAGLASGLGRIGRFGRTSGRLADRTAFLFYRPDAILAGL